MLLPHYYVIFMPIHSEVAAMLIENFYSKIPNAIGMLGVICLLIDYYLLSVNKISSNDLVYQLMNFFGASAILYSLFFEWNTPSVIIESAWVLISIIGICRILKTR